jgi:PBSX family phage portal protein
MAEPTTIEEDGDVRAYVIGDDGKTLSMKTAYTQASRGSRAMTIDDRLQNQYIAGRVLCPPYDIEALCALPEESSILPQCITAYVTNVAGFGWDFAYMGEEGKEQDRIVQDEKQTLKRFFSTVNDRESFITLHKRIRADLETTGNAYMEVIRNLKGEVVQLEHLPTINMRLGKIDLQAVVIKVTMQVGGDTITRWVRRMFRRYVQVQDVKKVWFKEFGDPRAISAKTGKVIVAPNAPPQKPVNPPPFGANEELEPNEEAEITINDMATEVLYFKLYSPQHVYGVPRYIGALLPIKGMRQAETVNWSYFNRNAIPPLLIMVSGGALTKSSFEQIMGYFQAQSNANLDRYHQALVLEATPKGTGLEDRGTVNIATKSLMDVRLSDAQFQTYEKNCTTKIRSAFRLPEIYVGLTEGMNYATASAARQTAEEQIFSVERQGFDEIINMQLLRSMNIRYWSYYTKGPEIADLDTYTKAVATFNSVGAMTPNQAIMLANELLGTTLKPVDQQWGDTAFPIVMQLVQQGKLAGLDDIMIATPAPGLPGMPGMPPGVPGAEPVPPILAKLGLNRHPSQEPPPFKQIGQELDSHATKLAMSEDEGVRTFAMGLHHLALKCSELGMGLAVPSNGVAPPAADPLPDATSSHES